MSFNTALFLSRLTLLAKEVKNAVGETQSNAQEHTNASPQVAANDGTINMKGKLDFIDQGVEQFFAHVNELLLSKTQQTEGEFAKTAINAFESLIVSEVDKLTDKAELFVGDKASYVLAQFKELKADHKSWFGA